MSSNTILQAYKSSLKTETSRQVIISAATPLELSKRDGIKYATFAIKSGNSTVTDYEEDWRAGFEAQILDITCFVETSDSHTDRDKKYQLMLDMADEVRDWIKTLDNTTISVNYTKFIGVIQTVDDQPGFYSQTLRLEFET